jgi:hypothetical protein
MPTLSSFTSPNQFQSETVPSNTQITAAYISGKSYVTPTFTSVGPSNDPGGIFGWLLYAKAVLSSPTTGATTDTYLHYTSPFAFMTDLNKLSGATGCLINSSGTANTYGFFIDVNDNSLNIQDSGNEFIQLLDYLAYGGDLVIAGNTLGLYNFETASNTKINLILGFTGSAFAKGITLSQKWLENESPNSIGVFSSYLNGNGYTAPAYSFSDVAFTANAVVADRVVTVYGQKKKTDLPVPSLKTNGKITVTNNLVSDVAGMFTRSNSRGELYLTIAGSDRGTALNGEVLNSVAWSNSTLRNTLKNNRVNFFLDYNPKFLGSDFVGATASSSDLTVDERIGPAQIKTSMRRDITDIGLKYLYEINNETTRAIVTSEIENYVLQYQSVLDTTQTQIVCNSTNNTDNSSNLAIFVSVKPLVATSAFTIDILLTA